MSYINTLADFLDNQTFDEYRADVLRWFGGYVDVRSDGASLVFFTTEKSVWWVRGLEMAVEWPTRWEGEMEQCEAWEEMARGKVPLYMGAWPHPHLPEHREDIERWQREAIERGVRPPGEQH